MIRFFLKERISDLEFQQARRITLDEVARSTVIHRSTLSKIANKKGYNCTIDNLDKLCRFFECRIEEIAEYLPNTLDVER
ncbi:MAG: helix-turn-helix transcriptional regulator [Lamprobacter sp.]|uniref:helix-turn-helix domain-containing protein n=1 Tax=Lamprobacter sp. TaxID=3100796 RepID=UPI002B261B59|nr:helix-turn-helix transcriptional regulator [Lamprobacter sp.]MEA3641504.1 helix-turn-helix transcriptional regulator [Lamprobacter sp.]